MYGGFLQALRFPPPSKFEIGLGRSFWSSEGGFRSSDERKQAENNENGMMRQRQH
jgi:hypothetical protein